MAGDLGVGAATAGVISPTVSMVTRSFGNTSMQARNAGGTHDQQLFYGGLGAAKEWGTNKLFDGLAGAYGKGSADDFVDDLARNLTKSEGGQALLRVILYYLTPEEIRIIKESGSTSAAERHALRGEVSPLSVDRIAQKQGEIKGIYTPYRDAYHAIRYQELERKFLDGSISPQEADELWELERIRGSFNVSNKLYLAVDF